MPTQQTILEIEFSDSDSDSDDEVVEKNPPKQVLEEPPKKRRKRLDLVQLGAHPGAPQGVEFIVRRSTI